MIIYVDPTEARENTRLDKNVLNKAVQIAHFEELTGADILVTPIKKKLSNVSDVKTYRAVRDYLSAPGTIENPGNISHSVSVIKDAVGGKHLDVVKAVAFYTACQYGVLIQRKSGNDLISSVHKLKDILFRMKQWTLLPYLLFCGEIKCNRDGNVSVDGRSVGIGYENVQAALDWWQLRGGYYTQVSRDNLSVARIVALGKIARKLKQQPVREVTPRQPAQILSKNPRLTTLTSIPDIGMVKAKRIYHHCRTLARSIQWLAEPEALNYDIFPFAKGIGLGEKTMPKIRRYIMGDDELMNKIEIVGQEVNDE